MKRSNWSSSYDDNLSITKLRMYLRFGKQILLVMLLHYYNAHPRMHIEESENYEGAVRAKYHILKLLWVAKDDLILLIESS